MEKYFSNTNINDSFNHWLNLHPLSEHHCDRRRKYEFYLSLLKYGESFNEEFIYNALKKIDNSIDAKILSKQIFNEFLLIADFYDLCELKSKIII
jgi:hypothetical protein